MLNIGIDIGTSKISGVALIGGKIVAKAGEANTFILRGEPYEAMQDAEQIYAAVLRILTRLTKGEKPASIGLTGQMHGALYVKDGRAASPLYTWQDGRGNLPSAEGGKRYVELLSERSGYPLATGYGLVTHCLLGGRYDGTLSTVHGYVAMRLSGRTKPVLHRTDAASFGFYDLRRDAFDRAALARCGDVSALPAVCGDECIGGNVVSAIGDNQASVYDALGMGSGLCVNVGTGSQVSAVVTGETAGGELRPYVGGKYLTVGSALCGGRAFALLKDFFDEGLQEMGLSGDVYGMLDRLAARAEGGVKCTPVFAGTREDPSATGSFTGITADNFHLGEFARAVLCGMAEELYTIYKRMGAPSAEEIVCAGNGARKNPLFRKILSETFCLPVRLTPHEEEAAAGAAAFAAEVMQCR